MKKAALLSIVCFASILSSVLGRDGEWIELFNGKDLAGWTVQCKPEDKDKVFWTVKDGAIVCDTKGMKHQYVWLENEREFSDFELHLKFRTYPNSGNSGLQFRSRYDSNLEKGGWMNGPQVDIHSPKQANWRTGLIYDETLGVRRWIYPSLPDSGIGPEHKPTEFVFKYADEGDGWNDLTLICKGMQIKTVVNGITRTDWDATGILDSDQHGKYQVGRSGRFALQLHNGDQLKIEFKDIKVRELTRL